MNSTITAPASVPVEADDRAVYTVKEAAHLLGLALGSTYALVRAGKIPARQLERRWVIPKAAFHAWLNHPSNQPADPHAGGHDQDASRPWAGGRR